MLGVEQPLQTRVQGNDLIIVTSDLGPEEAPCRHAYAFKITGGALLPER